LGSRITVAPGGTPVTPKPLRPAPSLALPLESITPGALNASVRQRTIRRTICRAGWTATIRPSSTYTSALKRKQMPLYGESGLPSAYEEDHLIPLELGGAPRDPRNLWPEPLAQSDRSDPLETRLKGKSARKRSRALRRAPPSVGSSSGRVRPRPRSNEKGPREARPFDRGAQI